MISLMEFRSKLLPAIDPFRRHFPLGLLDLLLGDGQVFDQLFKHLALRLELLAHFLDLSAGAALALLALRLAAHSSNLGHSLLHVSDLRFGCLCGFLFGCFLTILFTVRFLVEFVKENQESFENMMAINMGQILSIPFVLIGIFMMWKSFQTKKDIK